MVGACGAAFTGGTEPVGATRIRRCPRHAGGCRGSGRGTGHVRPPDRRAPRGGYSRSSGARHTRARRWGGDVDHDADPAVLRCRRSHVHRVYRRSTGRTDRGRSSRAPGGPRRFPRSPAGASSVAVPASPAGASSVAGTSSIAGSPPPDVTATGGVGSRPLTGRGVTVATARSAHAGSVSADHSADRWTSPPAVGSAPKGVAPSRTRSSRPLRRTTLAHVGAGGAPGILSAVLSRASTPVPTETPGTALRFASTSAGTSTRSPNSFSASSPRLMSAPAPGSSAWAGARGALAERSPAAHRPSSLLRALGPLPEIAARGNAAGVGAPKPVGVATKPAGVVRRSVGPSVDAPSGSGRRPTARASTAARSATPETPGSTARSTWLAPSGQSATSRPGQVVRRETTTLDRANDLPATTWARAAPAPANRRTFEDVRVGTARLLAAPPVAPPRGTPQPGRVAGPAVPVIPASVVAGRPASAAPVSRPTDLAVQAAPGSLISQIPASLFDRARLELGESGPGHPPVAPLAPAQASLSVTGATGGTQVTQPERRAEPIPLADQLSWQEWNQLVDIVVDRLEQRVIDELARRGRRFTPGVF